MIDFNNAIEIAKAHFLTKGEQHLTKIMSQKILGLCMQAIPVKSGLEIWVFPSIRKPAKLQTLFFHRERTLKY